MSDIQTAAVPRFQVGDMQRDSIVTLDLAGCELLIVNMLATPEELSAGGIGHRLETWPQKIRERMELEIAEFVKRNDGASIKGITTGVNGDNCVLAIHWRPRG